MRHVGQAAYGRVLRAAISMTGDKAVVARRLAVSVRRMDDWLEGKRPIPDQAFLLLVDIVEECAARKGRAERR